MGTVRHSKLALEIGVENAERRDRFLTLAGAFYDFTAALMDSFAERLAGAREGSPDHPGALWKAPRAHGERAAELR